jgi:hypothetical protein
MKKFYVSIDLLTKQLYTETIIILCLIIISRLLIIPTTRFSIMWACWVLSILATSTLLSTCNLSNQPIYSPVRTYKIIVITAADGLEHVHYSNPSITHIRYPLYDMQSERISRFFEDNYKNIEEGRLRGNVLIHCAAGISRVRQLNV